MLLAGKVVEVLHYQPQYELRSISVAVWTTLRTIIILPPDPTHSLDCKEVYRLKLTVNKDGVFLDDQKIRWVTRIDLQNIDPDDGMEAVLHVLITEAEVYWKVRE